MILRSAFRQRTPLQAICVPCRRSLLRQQQQRNFTVPKLTSKFESKDAPPQISGLFTPAGFDIAWTQYQNHIVDELNRHTTEIEQSLDLKTLVCQKARSSIDAQVFNFASMAFNNHFFFRTLQGPDPEDPAKAPESIPMPETLSQSIDEDFGSLESFQMHFLGTASAMFGPGFVWLMQEEGTQSLYIMATYNAGSPFPEAHYRHQTVEMNSSDGVLGGQTATNFAANIDSQSHLQPRNRTTYIGGYTPRSSKGKILAPNAIDAYPILCVNTWEHAWVPDFTLSGKDDYLQAWWERVDWREVVQMGTFRGERRYRPSRDNDYRARMQFSGQGNPVDLSSEGAREDAAIRRYP